MDLAKASGALRGGEGVPLESGALSPLAIRNPWEDEQLVILFTKHNYTKSVGIPNITREPGISWRRSPRRRVPSG
jgi:hypothetical protein